MAKFRVFFGQQPGAPQAIIKATFVAVEGLTNASGVITASRVYSADQPVVGWVRKSSGSPYYKTGPLQGTVDNSAGLSAKALLVRDD